MALPEELLGGWQINGIVQAQTGTPCSVRKSNDYAGVGNDGNFGCGTSVWPILGSKRCYHTTRNNLIPRMVLPGNTWFTRLQSIYTARSGHV